MRRSAVPSMWRAFKMWSLRSGRTTSSRKRLPTCTFKKQEQRSCQRDSGFAVAMGGERRSPRALLASGFADSIRFDFLLELRIGSRTFGPFPRLKTGRSRIAKLCRMARSRSLDRVDSVALPLGGHFVHVLFGWYGGRGGRVLARSMNADLGTHLLGGRHRLAVLERLRRIQSDGLCCGEDTDIFGRLHPKRNRPVHL